VSAALLDDLLAGYTAPVRLALAAPTPAKAANSAKSEHPCGFAGDLGAANGLRISANPTQPEADHAPDSQEFAAVRKPQTGLQSEDSCGSSQDSQDSQGCPPQCAAPETHDLSAVAWTDADIARFLDRRARLLRWGWAEPEAERLAERLVMRDRDQDARVSCTDCKHYRPGRCGNHKAAMLTTAEIGRDLAALLQHCPGFRQR
jgi:hypothetical protein